MESGFGLGRLEIRTGVVLVFYVLEKFVGGKKCRVGWGEGSGEIRWGCERPQTLTTLC